MRWPLRYQILLPFAGVMLAVVLGVSLLDAYLAARRTQQRIESQLREIAQTLMDANFPLTDAVLRQTRGLSGAEFLLTDRSGRLQSTSRPGAAEISLPPGVPRDRFSLGDPIDFDSQRYLHTAVAVRARGTEAEPMVLHILYPERFLREARWQAAYPPLVVGTALLGVVIALAIAIAGRMTRPILELRRQLGLLVQGGFQPMPLPARNDELRDLVGSVNTLADQLEELRRAIKRSERLAILGQLSGGMAHQLRNSVTGARLAVQLHQRRCQKLDPDSLAVALRQLSITESHLQRFLSAGQPSAPRRARCDLRQIISEVVALVGPTCQHRNVSLDADSLLDDAVELSADADQLRQLMMNLVLNAVEAAGPGGWVRIEASADGTHCTVRVVDSGPGPPEAIRDRLFEAFATGKPEGIGLGLAVAKAIAEVHGGVLRYVTGGATCFETILPVGMSGDTPYLKGAALDSELLEGVLLHSKDLP